MTWPDGASACRHFTVALYLIGYPDSQSLVRGITPQNPTNLRLTIPTILVDTLWMNEEARTRQVDVTNNYTHRGFLPNNRRDVMMKKKTRAGLTLVGVFALFGFLPNQVLADEITLTAASCFPLGSPPGKPF